MDEPIIKKLDESVVNRIAAGEVIQRPANALKEMIENSIDAKSNNIQIVVKDGGLKLLQITDNGTGIRKDDFTIVCERFTTSKLEKFEDLSTISTYGFRGEALASISHVAHLTIQSRTAAQDCAYKASYIDSKLKESPKPCAGNKGTTITVEDLFYNMSTRKKAMKNTNDEFRKISDMLGKYSIHNSSVSFSLKKYGENVTIKTPGNSTIVDNIRIIYGNEIAKELIEFECSDNELKFTSFGLVTNVNYSTKKSTFILFINNRLVESTVIKKSIDQIFSTYLPKNTYPFVYLSLNINPENIDVNVHPTKHQVHFLYEEQIVEKITKVIDSKLLNSNNSRVFYTQAKLPGAELFSDQPVNKDPNKTIHDKHLVRTNCTEQKLDKFFKQSSTLDDTSKPVLNLTSTIIEPSKVQRKTTQLTSVLRLRKKIEESSHLNLRELITQHVFVGCVDVNRALIQHSTKLYLCSTRQILQELCYQLILYDFQNFGCITFKKALPLNELILTALDLPEVGWSPDDGDKQELMEAAVQILKGKAAMLEDYFSLKICDEHLISIPLLIDSYIPEMAGLPKYILRLATDVIWSKEQECFETFARETAAYYSTRNQSNIVENTNWKWTTEYVIYPAMKKYLLPPKSFANNAVLLQIADLPDLYKVFERC